MFGIVFMIHSCQLMASTFFSHTVVLNDMKFEHLRRLVEYLYCGKTKLNASELDDFFLAVKRYKILGLNESSGAPSASNVQCSMVYELQSGDDNGENANDDDDDGNDENEHNQTDKPAQHEKQRNKRKIDEIDQNESDLQWASRKSIPNVSKRACALPEQQQQQQQPINLQPVSPLVSAPASDKTPTIADANAATNGTTPSNNKSANGKLETVCV